MGHPTTMTTTVTISTLLLAVMLVPGRRSVEAVGYSYARFVGPVIGPERRIVVPDRFQGAAGTAVDYVAQPKYHFAYGVEDKQHNLLQNRRETRNGDTVHGMYSVYDPDGVMRVVKYTANDKNGFQAEVISNGVATAHGVPGSTNVVHIQHDTRSAVNVQPSTTTTTTDGEQESDSDEDTESDTKDGSRDDETEASEETDDSSEASDHRGSRESGESDQGSHQVYEYASYDGYSSEDGDDDGDADDDEVDESSIKATRLKPGSSFKAEASQSAYSHRKASR